MLCKPYSLLSFPSSSTAFFCFVSAMNNIVLRFDPWDDIGKQVAVHHCKDYRTRNVHNRECGSITANITDRRLYNGVKKRIVMISEGSQKSDILCC